MARVQRNAGKRTGSDDDRRGAQRRRSSPRGPRRRRPWRRTGAWLVVAGALAAGAVALAVPQTPATPESPATPHSPAASDSAATPDSQAARRASAAPRAPQPLRARVVETYPHASDAFTQGLLWHDGKLYESTGLHGRSSLREVDPQSGKVLRRRDLPKRLFAEGLARVGDRLVQLTWRRGKALVWKLDDLARAGSHTYDGQGWGLCHDGTHLVMSDGSATLTFRDPDTFDVRRKVQVTRGEEPVRRLNELECVQDAVWANVWKSDHIVRIDPESGDVTARVDATGLLSAREAAKADVLNGIAFVPDEERFLLTGKLWPHVFEVEMVPHER